ncbi:hypothetical protein [Aminiphilus sp.]|uniref:hypothetical protein n=1 Tax=Aminiphilus sp. TaxID=1872488 RepID=UPI00262DAE63|nr:hypothetical protein [Aminiphilus sp.]
MNSGMPRKNPLSAVRLLVLALLGILTFFGLPRLPEHFASPVLHLVALCCFCLAWGGSRAAVNASCEPDPEKGRFSLFRLAGLLRNRFSKEKALPSEIVTLRRLLRSERRKRFRS